MVERAPVALAEGGGGVRRVGDFDLDAVPCDFHAFLGHGPVPFFGLTGCGCNPSRPAPMSGGMPSRPDRAEGDHPACTSRHRRRGRRGRRRGSARRAWP